MSPCVLILLPLLISLGKAKTHSGFSIPLVHHDAPKIIAAASSPMPSLWLQDEKFHSVVDFVRRGYQMELQIGSGYAKIYVSFDTASDLTWLRCFPLGNMIPTPESPLYNTFSSKAYKQLTANSPMCWYDNRVTVTSRGCQFNVTYLDKGSVEGVLASDTFHFDTFMESDGFHSSFHNVVFGCATTDDSKETGDMGSSGIFGLGYSSISFVSQLSVKMFSYCIPPPSPMWKIAQSSIRFGFDARTPGHRTPLMMPHPLNKYVIKLQEISFGSSTLPIKFPNQGYFEMVVNTGTLATYLPYHAYYPVVEEVQKNITLQPLSIHPKLNTCYNGTMEDVNRVRVTLHFGNGANLELFGHQLFYQFGEHICLVVVQFESPVLAILGSAAQTGMNIGFDLANKEVAFSRVDCDEM